MQIKKNKLKRMFKLYERQNCPESDVYNSTQAEGPILRARSQICTQYMLGVRFDRACHLALLYRALTKPIVPGNQHETSFSTTKRKNSTANQSAFVGIKELTSHKYVLFLVGWGGVGGIIGINCWFLDLGIMSFLTIKKMVK